MELSQPMQDIPMPAVAKNPEDASILNATSSSKMSDPVDGKNVNLSSTDKKEVIKKASVRPTASVMVLESIQSLNKRIGSTAEEIYQHIETAYNVEIKDVKPYVNRFLNSAFEKGLLENAGGVGDKVRFKAKQSANVKKETQKSKEGAKKEKTKNKSATKRQKPKETEKKETTEKKSATKRQKPKERVKKAKTDKKSATKRQKPKEKAKKEKTKNKSVTKSKKRN